jgi:hypothetical protein
MKRSRWSKAVGVAYGLLATGCLAVEPTAATDLSDAGQFEDGGPLEKVINGTTNQGDSNVVMLRSRSRGFCTGTLISPTVVLTAAHCLDGGSPAFVGFGVSGTSNQIAVRRGVQHPSWGRSGGYANDIAVLVLAQSVRGVAPKPISVDPREAIAGDVARVVGYGNNRTAGTGFGTKREGDVSVLRSDGVTERQFVKVGSSAGTQACNGDSGGPVFFTDRRGVEKVVGVTSHGATSCKGGSFHTRVAAHLDFLDDYIDVGGTGGGTSGGGTSGGGTSGGGGGGSCHTVPPNDSDYCTSSCPCNEGEGDCDRDSQCAGNLVCREQGSVDRCVRPSSGGSACNAPVVNRGNGLTGYGECEGDCDRDSDCQPGLRCVQLDTGDAVPGCSGRSSSNNDYCVVPACL